LKVQKKKRAAVCNAIFHAIGERLRDLPITLDDSRAKAATNVRAQW
jgi:CO/xanthine dehydrogenase Mo-binding subunit